MVDYELFQRNKNSNKRIFESNIDIGSKIRVLIKEYKNNYFNILNIKIPGFLYIYKIGLYSTYFPRFETLKIPNMKHLQYNKKLVILVYLNRDE